ncbi:Protein vip1 [Friedmanniomyces endolithicus]|nr:Protein vip1 [Friedmanniomyces endolithicus]KAK0834660.1 Protein vip1 [Friedmanniomyces endolithicus]
MSNTVHVKGISGQTSEKEVRDFFSFCGKIHSLSVTPESGEEKSAQSATVTFEKETAAKTALLLDNTQLGSAQVHVSSAASLDQMSGGKAAGSSEESDDLAQEDKPRSR